MDRRAWFAPLLLTTVVACGARTGLRTPDVVVDVPVVDAPATRPAVTCIELAEDAGVITVNLETRPQVSVADVFFLIDRTGSMDGEIDNIKANLQRTIVPAIARAIDDVQFGVATYADFPLRGPDGVDYGDPTDIPLHARLARRSKRLQRAGRRGQHRDRRRRRQPRGDGRSPLSGRHR